MMKVAVFGANGRCGSKIGHHLLKEGHEVVAAVRRPKTVTSRQGLSVCKIDFDQQSSLRSAVKGCDAVVLALGLGSLKASAKPTTLFSDSVRAVRRAMREEGCSRIIALSSGGVVWDETAPGFYTTLLRRYLVNCFLDLVRMETILEESDMEWTAIRLTYPKDGPSKPLKVAEGELGGGLYEVHYCDVGKFVAKEIDAREWINMHPVLGYEIRR